MQVTNGKNNMPAFGGRLTEEQIVQVSRYVAYQTNEGWNKNPLYVKYPGRYVPADMSQAYNMMEFNR